MSYRPSEPVMSTYVHHEDKCWNVSTIYRQCSSYDYDRMYYETIVWEWDDVTHKRGRICHQDEGLEAHCSILERVVREGAFWEKVQDDD